MKPTIDAFWKFLERQCVLFSKDNLKLSLDGALKDSYALQCDQLKESIREEYMRSDVEFLDRHKIAAVMVVKGLELGIVCPDSNGLDRGDELYIGPEKLLLIGAVNYLTAELSQQLKECNVPPMQVFLFPEPFSCDTLYIDASARLLRYARNEGRLSVLDIADKLFLLEYIAIGKYYGAQSEENYRRLREL